MVVFYKPPRKSLEKQVCCKVGPGEIGGNSCGAGKCQGVAGRKKCGGGKIATG